MSQRIVFFGRHIFFFVFFVFFAAKKLELRKTTGTPRSSALCTLNAGNSEKVARGEKRVERKRCREEEEEEEEEACLGAVRRKVEVDCLVEERRRRLRKDRSDPRPGERFRLVRQRRRRRQLLHQHVHRQLLHQHAEREVVS